MKQLCIVTGASGRIGRLLCPALELLGVDVLGIDRINGSNTVEHDLARSLPNLPSTARTIWLVHLAATSSPRDTTDYELMSNNINCGFIVSGLLNDPRVTRALIMSSEAVYGAAYSPPSSFVGWRFPIEEIDTPLCVDSYGLSKLFVERIFLNAAIRRPDVALFILRSCYIIFPATAEQQLGRLRSDVAYAKSKLFSFVYSQTVVDCIISCLMSPERGCRTFNVAEDGNILNSSLSLIVKQYFEGAQLRRGERADKTNISLLQSEQLRSFLERR